MNDTEAGSLNLSPHFISKLYCWPLRIVSFFFASAVSLIILFMPQLVASSTEGINHGALSLCLWGVSAGFVYGIGYVPRLLIWRILLGPLVVFPAIIVGVIEWGFLK